MFKYIAVLTLFAVAVNAGYFGDPLAYSAPLVAAPIAVKTAVPVATSYQNTFKISAAPIPVVVKAAPVLTAAPIIKAAPIIAAAPAVHYAHAPLVTYH